MTSKLQPPFFVAHGSVIVRANLAVVLPFATLATTSNPPTRSLAVTIVAAVPSAPVVAIGVLGLPEAPLAGAVNVTAALATTFPNASVTFTTRAAANSVPAPADWPPPEMAVTFLAAPASLVSENDTGDASAADAETT